MELKIKTNYTICETKSVETTHDFDKCKAFVEDYLIYCEDINKKDIKYALDAYLWEILVIKGSLYLENDFKNVQDTLDIYCLNLDEVLDEFSYLLTENPSAGSCCDSQTGNYCSVCGKKLK